MGQHGKIKNRRKLLERRLRAACTYDKKRALLFRPEEQEGFFELSCTDDRHGTGLKGNILKRNEAQSGGKMRISHFIKRHVTGAFFAALLTVFLFSAFRYTGLSAAGRSVHVGTKRPVVVIDAGHGGNDPGKVGVDQSLEKDINLKIAKKLAHYLEQADVQTILTREEDKGLYSETDTRKKSADMKARCRLIGEAEPDLVVSIHQNSYHQEQVSGGQVFYYTGSVKGKRLAEAIQKRFDYVLGKQNTRKAKANDSYYLLLHVKCPIVIVECGFLSNWQEAARLNSPEYQDRMAWTIHMGVMEYLNTR